MTSPLDNVLSLRSIVHAGFLSDTTNYPMLTSKSVCRMTVGQNIQWLREKTELTSPLDYVLSLRSTAHVRFLSDTTHYPMLTSKSVCCMTVRQSIQRLREKTDFDFTVEQHLESEKNNACLSDADVKVCLLYDST